MRGTEGYHSSAVQVFTPGRRGGARCALAARVAISQAKPTAALAAATLGMPRDASAGQSLFGRVR